jgi:hypothetical protein
MSKTESFKANLDNLLASIVTDIDKLKAFSKSWQAGGVGNLKSHRYSFNNQMLIFAQNETASLVAGFNAWKEFNRNVLKGGKAIFIAAPHIIKNELPDEDDEVLYRYIPVFDVSQTEGEELPEFGNPHLISGGTISFDDVVSKCPFKVEIDPNPYNVSNGIANLREECITLVKRGNPKAMTVTLFHEWAHIALNHLHRLRTSPAAQELEAEATSFLVSRYFGFDNDKAASYIGNWTKNNSDLIPHIDSKRVMQTAGSIVDCLLSH